MEPMLAGIVAVAFTSYPALGDRAAVTPRPMRTHPRVEATIDKGPIVEVIVRCPRGFAMLSYSEIERLYCSPRFHCSRDLADIVLRSCG